MPTVLGQDGLMDRTICLHDWVPEQVPDPLALGGVQETGQWVCLRCGATREG